jgi:hypothetical protein
MEVEEASVIAGFERDHQLVIRVGRQNLGHRECSPCSCGITSPRQPETRPQRFGCIFSLSPPWRFEEDHTPSPAFGLELPQKALFSE